MGKRKTSSMRVRNTRTILMFVLATIYFAAYSQQDLSLPPIYRDLKTDTARMRFLTIVIQDSLNEAQLSPVLGWSRLGLQMAEKNESDTMKGIFNYFIGKAFTYKYLQYDSAIIFYKKVLPYFPGKLRKYNVYAVREIMERYADLGNRDSSFVYMDMLTSLIDTMPDSSPRKIALSQNIATVYQFFGMYRTAIRYFQVAIKGNRQNKNFRGLGLALANLGELYNTMDDKGKAITVSKEALQYLADVNMPYIQTAANIAEYYVDQAQLDSALAYIHKSEDVAARINDFETRLINRTILARIYIRQKKYDLARSILDSNLAAFSRTDDRWNQCRAMLAYADLDTTTGKYALAKDHLNKVLVISGQNEFGVFTLASLQNLVPVYANLGDYKSALHHQSAYAAMKDSIAGEKVKADLSDLEISYKTLQKEQQIVLLQKDNAIKELQVKNSNRAKILYLLVSLFVIVLVSVLFYQHSQSNKIRFQQMKAELETKVLRLQMNPHFIFNSLNSIENFIMQNEKRLASDYLNKFARLIRMILDSSRNEVVPISKDMEALQLYIDLEQLRFNNKFNYKTYIDPALTAGDYRVPSLLIQPYVENAIVHGLAHSEDSDLSLVVSATLENEEIKYVVQDNGVGRNKAREYNRKNKPYHHSIGLELTEARVNIFNQENKNDSILFTDLVDEHNNPTGTKVEVKIKAA